MGDLSKWLTHDDQKDLFEVLFATTLNVVFLVLIALLLWPLGKPRLAFSLAKGFVVLWIAIVVIVAVVNRLHRILGVNLYDHSNVYVISGLAVSCAMQAGWSIFAAITIHNFAAGASTWLAVVLYGVGVLSCLTAFFAVSSFYQGHIYKFISLPLALIVFVAFSLGLPMAA